MPDGQKLEYSPETVEKNGKWQDLVDYCLRLYNSIKKSEYRANKIQEAKESRRVYEQIEKKTSDPWEGASNIELPLVTISVDNLEPRIVSSMAGQKPYIEFEKEVEQQQQNDDISLLQAWYNNELEDAVHIAKRAGEVAHNLLLDGTVFPIVSYDIDENIVRDFVFEEDVQAMGQLPEGAAGVVGGIVVDATGQPLLVDKKEPVFEGGKVDILPFTDVFIPDDADDWEKTPVIRRLNPTYAELRRDSESKPGYMNIDTWLIKEQEEGLAEGDKSPAQEQAGVSETGKKTIRCIECYISYIYKKEDETEEDIQDFTEERLVALIALDRKVLIRLLPLRELNFKNEHLIKRLRLFPEKGRAYGTSIYGKMKAIQKGASKTFNTAINITDVVMIPWFLFTDRAGFKSKQTKLKPGMGVPVDDVSQVYFPRFSINPGVMTNFINIWVAFWERLISIGDLQVGRPSQGSEGGKGGTTATEVMAVIQEGNVKHNYQAQTFRDEFLSVLRTLYDLYYQHMPPDKSFEFNGQPVVIPRKSMRRNRSFRLTGSTELSNKVLQRKDNEAFYSFVVGDPNGIFDPLEAAKDLVKAYGRTNIQKYINPQVARIVATIKQFPETAQLFEEAAQKAMEMAQAIDQEGKQIASVAMTGGGVQGG